MKDLRVSGSILTTIMLVLLYFASIIGGNAQNVGTQMNGSWGGKLDLTYMKLRLVMNIEDDKCTMDSPDQGVKDIPANVEYKSEDSIYVKVPSIGASYEGHLRGDELQGTFKQNGISLKLMLKKAAREVVRPQTPMAPYPYTCEEVTFGHGDVVLTGTLTLPEKMTENTPVVVMVNGSGQQNRDSELYEHKPFLVIADYLARHGIATLRYDDRGKGGSKGDVANATTLDFAKDAESGIDFLRKRFKKVGVIGHSEGGTIAFMLGEKKKVDFIVSLAGSMMKGEDVLVDQQIHMSMVLGVKEEVARLKEKAMREAIRKTDQSWMKFFIDYDPKDAIMHTTCPVFALNGEKDMQVYCKQQIETLKKYLPERKENKIKIYPELNHLFQHCTTGEISEYGDIEETISEEVLADMTEWVWTVNR